MNDNRFSPPTAEVADAARPPLTRRPTQIVVALWLLSISIVGVLASSLYQIATRFPKMEMVQWEMFLAMILPLIVTTVIGVSVWTVLTVKASVGRHWARIAMSVCLLLSWLPVAFVSFQMSFTYSWRVVFGLWPDVMRVIALGLMFFGPGKDWFAQNRA